MCPGRRFEVRFEGSRGNVPLLEIETLGLTGSELHLSVEEVRIQVQVHRTAVIIDT